MQKLLVTAALPYANGPIHIGHLVEYILADIWVRYWRLRKRDVVYLCADDTHGTAVMLRAQKEGVSPETLIARVWHEHVRDLSAFGVAFDLFHTTHSEENRELSAQVYQALQENGHVRSKSVNQAYCGQDLMFLPDRYIRGRCPHCAAEDQYGDSCASCSRPYSPEELGDPACSLCGQPPEWRESAHLFVNLGPFEGMIRDWFARGGVRPEVANKLREWLDAGLKDWDISRDAPYFGFEIPDHPGKYFYVWLDAPIGYMATTLAWCKGSEADFASYWRNENDSEVVHVIGKDIIPFHGLFWPAVLSGSGFRVPTQLVVHGFLTVQGEKMSKSRGTLIEAALFHEHLGSEFLRYYYAAKLTPGMDDIDLNFADFQSRVNADLVNTLANIPSRCVGILHRHNAGRLGLLDVEGRRLVEGLRARAVDVEIQYAQRDFAHVCRSLKEMADEVNAFLQERAPWQEVSTNAARAAASCTAALNGFRILTTLLQPVLPRWAEVVSRLFGLTELTWEEMSEDLEGSPIGSYERLIERLELNRLEALLAAAQCAPENAGRAAIDLTSAGRPESR